MSPSAESHALPLAQVSSVVRELERAVSTERVKSLAEVVLAHRLIVKRDRQDGYRDGHEVIKEVIDGVRKPD